jgi:hypothetical protein
VKRLPELHLVVKWNHVGGGQMGSLGWFGVAVLGAVVVRGARNHSDYSERTKDLSGIRTRIGTDCFIEDAG